MAVLLTTGVIVLAAAIGVWAERRRPQSAAAAARRALTLILYVLLPPAIFFIVASSQISIERGVGLVLGLVAIALAALFAYLICSRFLQLSRAQTGAVISAVLCINSAYLGYPLTVALLGSDALSVAALYDQAVAGPSLLLGAFAVGAAFGTKAGEGPRERVGAFFTRNPPLYAAVAGLLAPEALAPDLAVDLSQALIVSILPIGFFAVGATLAENAEQGELSMPPPMTPPVAVALVTRLAVAPGLLLLLAAPLVALPGPYLLLAAMPTGLNSMVVAHAYGLDMEITAEAVVWSTAIVVIAAACATLLL
jgi:malate permease and related proteins